MHALWLPVVSPRKCDGRTMKPRDALDAMTDKVLSYRPKPKSEPAKARKRRAAKLAKKRR